jgi:hypothetical protein
MSLCRYHRRRSGRPTEATNCVFYGSKRRLKTTGRQITALRADLAIANYHPRSEQTCWENSSSRYSFSSRRDSTCVGPGGGRVSGNLHEHTLHSYPRRLSISTSLRSADLAKRGFAISAFSSSTSFWEDFFLVATPPVFT